MSNPVQSHSQSVNDILYTSPGVLASVGLFLAALSLGTSLALSTFVHASFIAVGLFLGGLLLILAAPGSWSRGCEAAAVLFAASGLFALSLPSLLILPQLGVGTQAGSLVLSSYLIMWSAFFAIMTSNFHAEGTSRNLTGSLALLGTGLTVFAMALLFRQPFLENVSGIILLCSALTSAPALLKRSCSS